MHYLITGHTGFKGAWLTLWLTSQGHEVSGISLDPLNGALYETAKVSELVSNDFRIDIRDSENLKKAINKISPDVVFHLAAQPLVRESYKKPRETFETNIMGTYNLLEAVSSTPSVQAQVIVTTDKVYRNVNQIEGYKENDPLGGEDPYSASKAAADILTHAWVSSFPSPPTAIVRAGNVIGGGDVSSDRLLPDLISAYTNNKIPTLRYPEAVRPWQHVLDCLNGYIKISKALISGLEIGEINIGPAKESFVPVSEVADLVAKNFGRDKSWMLDSSVQLKEANLLALNSLKAQLILDWRDNLKFVEAVEWTVNWHKRYLDGEAPRNLTLEQINTFIKNI